MAMAANVKPEFPTIRPKGNKAVKAILSDLDVINQTKNPHKRLQRSEALIYKITSSLRKSTTDHLYQTTSIWVLINVFRADPPSMREVMLQCGVPGVLYDMLRNQLITGSTRQYASELCFYLTSENPYPLPEQLPKTGGPIKSLPEIHRSDRLEMTEFDLMTTVSELSSIASVDARNGLSAFVPYRINDTNMKRMKELFDVGTNEYEKLEKALPHGLVPSRYGFSDMLLFDPKTGKRMKPVIPMSSSSNGGYNDAGNGDSEDDMSLEDSTLGSATYVSHSSTKRTKESLGPLSALPVSRDILTNSFALRSNGLPYNLNQNKMVGLGQYNVNPNMRAHNPLAQNHQSATILAPPSQQAFIRTPSTNSQANYYRPQTSTIEEDDFDASYIQPSHASHSNSSVLSQEYSNYQQMQRTHAQGSAMFHIRPVPTSPTYAMNQTGGMRQSLSAAPSSVRHLNAGVKVDHPFNGRYGGDGEGSVGTMTRSHPVSDYNRPHTHTPSVHSTATSNEKDSNKMWTSKLRSKMNLPQTVINANLSSYDPMKTLEMPESLADIDPLSLNVSIGFHAAFRDNLSMTKTIYSDDDDEDDDDEDDLYEQEQEGRDDDDNNGETSRRKQPNKYITAQKVRMRAEKLIDHSFIKRMFTKQTTIADTQSLLYRLEEILTLMDSQKSGFVTWEAFSRTLLALAPQHLLRADVLAFLEAQGCAMDSQIAYRDFLISGKVLVVEKNAGQPLLPVTGWLNRVVQAPGNNTDGREERALTWKAHRKWYRKRRAVAVVWLMRRATKAFQKGELFNDAVRYLRNEAKRAFALNFLMYAGQCAMQAEGRRSDAKRRLMLRIIHAKRYKVVREEAFVFLKQSAVETVTEEKRKEVKLELQKRFPSNKPPQANIIKVYLRQHQMQVAIRELRGFVEVAWVHTRKINAAFDWLTALGTQVTIQAQLHEETSSWLSQRADSALKFLTHKDGVWKSLIRIGGNAYKYLVNQEEALAWMLQRGNQAKVFSQRKDDDYARLSGRCQWTLRFLNRREDAYSFLKDRSRRALRLEEGKHDAVIYLRRFPAAIWAAAAKIDKTYVLLKRLGEKAIRHSEKKHKAWNFLQYVGQRATVVRRRISAAHAELQQIGLYAKYVRFEQRWCSKPQNVPRVQEERKKQVLSDAENERSRIMTIQTPAALEELWRLELYDAFVWTSRLYCPISTVELLGIVEKPEEKIGMLAFRRMLNDGKLLGYGDVLEVDAQFKSIDTAHKCWLTFPEVWHWFTIVAHQRNSALVASGKKALKFTLATVYSPAQRAVIALLRRTLLAEAKSFFDENGGMASLDLSFMGNFDGLFSNNDEDGGSSTDESEGYDPKLGDEFGDDYNGKLMRRLKLHGNPQPKKRGKKKKKESSSTATSSASAKAPGPVSANSK